MTTILWLFLRVLIANNRLSFGFEAGVETSEEIERTDMYVLPGRKAELPCNITPEVTDDNLDLVLWYTDKSPSPFYSLDARHGNVHSGRHWKSDDMASRAYFNITGTMARLQLDPVIKEDEGSFLCRVDFRIARTRYLELGLRIIVPPSKPVVKNVAGQIQQSLIGPYNEGDSLRLQCEVIGGNPRPNLTWWRESVLLDDSYEIIDNFIVRNVIEIPVLQRHDLMATFTCLAVNNDVLPPLQSTVAVDMNFRPLEVHIVGERRPLLAGKPVKIECSTSGSRPPAEVTWWKEDIQLKSVKSLIPANGNSTLSTLTFKPSAEDDGKTLFCSSENRHIPGSAVKASWKLEVIYKPILTLQLGREIRNVPIQEGSDVYMECEIMANPPITKIEWKCDGEDISGNYSAGIIINNQTLFLKNVQRLNRGRYSCTATSDVGQGESNFIYLRVQYSPICKPNQKILYTGALNQPVEVSCNVESDPDNVTFIWTFNSSADNRNLLDFKTVGPSSILTYVPKFESDFGTLICTGMNSIGLQMTPCVFSIVAAGLPEPLENCTLTNLTQTVITMECVEGHDGGLRQKFYAEVFHKDLNELATNFTTQSPIFFVGGLNPGCFTW
ncbi:neural cell adhesion molecule 2-like [Tachypleus tridentatus]|uniref:neural cell adhesion molecule 2-like n=1 Tax=Tachypleus tridentatus TaxID=6853 RepID=UPI003FCF34E1